MTLGDQIMALSVGGNKGGGMAAVNALVNTLQGNQAVQNRYGNQMASVYDQVGRAAMQLSGTPYHGNVNTEGTFVVAFPNPFAERPTFTFGFEMDDNQNVTNGNFLQATAFVLSWNTVGDANSPTYTGATIGVVGNGAPDLTFWVHFRFSGWAVAFPAGANPTNGTGTA